MPTCGDAVVNYFNFSLMFASEGQLVFTGGQTFLKGRELSNKKDDGGARRTF